MARASGVSRGTVSRVLNGGHWVSDGARAAVEAAIESTGYRINAHARSLATSRGDSVAFLLTERQERLFEDPNFSTLMRGATDVLAEHDMTLVLLLAGTDDDQRRASDFIRTGRVDGALLVSSHAGRLAFLRDLVDAHIPVVSCGAPLGFESSIGYVGADDAEGARRMAAHLRAAGRERIALIAGPQDTSGGLDRLAGFTQEMGQTDPARIAYGDFSRASGDTAMQQLLRTAPDVDAVFAANDVMAVGAIDALRRAGRKVPDDVAVAGFDDAPIASRVSPALTTMRQPFDRIARDVVGMLLDVIAGRPAGRLLLPTELVVRESA